MQSLLVLYMVNKLLHPGHIERIAGFGPFRHLLESIYRGPLPVQALAFRVLADHIRAIKHDVPEVAAAAQELEAAAAAQKSETAAAAQESEAPAAAQGSETAAAAQEHEAAAAAQENAN